MGVRKNGGELRQTLGGNPERRFACGRCDRPGGSHGEPGGALCFGQRREKRLPLLAASDFILGNEGKPQQRIVQLVGVDCLGPRLRANAFNRFGIESTHARCRFFVQPTAAHHGAGPTLLEYRQS